MGEGNLITENRLVWKWMEIRVWRLEQKIPPQTPPLL